MSSAARGTPSSPQSAPAFRKPKKGAAVVVTPYLHCAGLGEKLGHGKTEVRKLIIDALRQCNVSESLSEAQVHTIDSASYVFLDFGGLQSSQRVQEALNGVEVTDSFSLVAKRRVLRLSFAELRPPKSAPGDGITCTSEFVLLPPGLRLLKDFLTPEEEATLFGDIDRSPWDESLARRVQHMGYQFNYGLRGIDFEAETPPLPAHFAALAGRIAEVVGLKPEQSPNQITVNEYRPGQGIAPHIDTHGAFDGTIVSLSIGSGITMDFRRQEVPPSLQSTPIRQQALFPPKRRTKEVAPAVPLSAPPAASSRSAAEEGNGVPSSDKVEHKRCLLWLPPRSLLVLQEESRYQWTHGIAPRKADKVNGELILRGSRTSLTFRHVLLPGEFCCCGCGEAPPACVYR